jgi:hypothetical protein
VEEFSFKKEAQTGSSSQGTGRVGTGGHQRISSTIEDQLLMLLYRLAASTPIGAAGSVTPPFAPICSAAASQSSTKGPPSTPTLGTCP